jgi:bacteriocin biosynthesis cyclodehydratase domain-containing protein
VNPAFTATVVTDNHVEFRAGPFTEPVTVVSEPQGAGGPAALVDALDGETDSETVVAVADRETFDAAATLANLVDKHVVVDSDSQIRAYREYLTAGERGEQRHLLVIGDGRVAAGVAADAAAASGLSVDRLGVGAETAFDAQASVGSVDLQARVADVDHVVSATDTPRPQVETRLNDSVLSTETPWTRARVDGSDAVIGPTVVPHSTACLQCYRTRRDANVSGVEQYQHHLVRRRDADQTALPPAFGRLVAGVLGAELHRQLGGQTGVTVGRVVYYDLRQLAVEANEVLRLPQCDACRDTVTTVDDPRNATLKSMFDEVTDRDT